jgi:lysyl-tRNA synthetase class 2
MAECEELLDAVRRALGLGDTISYRGGKITLPRPWKRLSVTEAFARFSPCSLSAALARGIFDQIMVDVIEPALGTEKPVFLYDYPLAPGSLAVAKADDAGLVERFELYMGGLELANAFSELTDADEQRRRFTAAREERGLARMDPYPLPEEFLAALALMPPAAGIALGVDRLAMIFADVAEIEAVVAFPRESG